MYCSACGAAVTQGLSFCNFCGAKLGGAKSDAKAPDASKPPETFPESLVWAIVTVFIVGLGCTIGLMAMMKGLLDFKDDIIITVMLTCFLLMFVIEAAFLWLLLRRRKDDAKEASISGTDAAATQLKEQTTKVLDAAQPQLQPARSLVEPIPSITEHTTRSFEPVYTKQKAE